MPNMLPATLKMPLYNTLNIANYDDITQKAAVLNAMESIKNKRGK